MKLSIVILNLILPPVAVYIKYGAKKFFLVNLLLTCLGWIPGVIHAFIINDKYIKLFRKS
ncbi:YqaE/Pmp3 family membrane protein [Zunongwangia sp. HGR-M22]|uniref:YqaE/Pmp3 family membrane protein n=1 Tax=Zunongwangia sp. HGR-M22 TaxID=3015168 RepID=UPI0022DD94D1|nr:YqaE/Pmp3 family membrane protein [Zunongwangia sp. HGR-M22]WBL24232.1 YqaE/Pmp3 family membrane protein [Zunongwangia sp. HGR-M22]